MFLVNINNVLSLEIVPPQVITEVQKIDTGVFSKIGERLCTKGGFEVEVKNVHFFRRFYGSY